MIAGRLNITRLLWEEFNTQSLHDFLTGTYFYNTPAKTVLSADRIPSKYLRTSNVTVAEQRAKHIEVAARKDKRAKVVTAL